MDLGGDRRAPYWAVVQLWHWATDRWSWIDGQLLLAGLDPGELPAWRLLNVIYALMAAVLNADNRDEVTRRMDDWLRKPPAPERATWGTQTTMTEEQRLTLAQYGPPPGFRPQRKRSLESDGEVVSDDGDR